MTLTIAMFFGALAMISMMIPPNTYANQTRNFSTRTAFYTSL
jgi:hypothetical protein